MPRTCMVCRHPERELIEEELARGEPLRNIELTYRLGYSSLHRHRINHMIVADDNGTKVVAGLQDVINIPLQMKERTDLTTALIDQTLEPLFKPQGKIDDIQTGFLIRLLQLQQGDEQTIIKMTGKIPGLREEEVTKDTSNTSSYLASDAQEKLRQALDDWLGSNSAAKDAEIEMPNAEDSSNQDA